MYTPAADWDTPETRAIRSCKHHRRCKIKDVTSVEFYVKIEFITCGEFPLCQWREADITWRHILYIKCSLSHRVSSMALNWSNRTIIGQAPGMKTFVWYGTFNLWDKKIIICIPLKQICFLQSHRSHGIYQKGWDFATPLFQIQTALQARCCVLLQSRHDVNNPHASLNDHLLRPLSTHKVPECANHLPSYAGLRQRSSACAAGDQHYYSTMPLWKFYLGCCGWLNSFSFRHVGGFASKRRYTQQREIGSSLCYI